MFMITTTACQWNWYSEVEIRNKEETAEKDVIGEAVSIDGNAQEQQFAGMSFTDYVINATAELQFNGENTDDEHEGKRIRRRGDIVEEVEEETFRTPRY